ncbi:transcription antitermination factor NusB [Dongshaea marina]|uniref:transcription antitermination factor NusB n=1 Tax=Dongshaea marina TaxID=2047966 RepID=UPI000D3EBB14|nr:transcription antitermination factor NusB [Dongshaea marina]
MKPSERRKARRFATQAIYQWQITQDPITDIEEQFKVDQDMKGTDLDYFSELASGVAVHTAELDQVIAPLLSRPFEEVDMVDKAILRLAFYEFVKRPDIPYKVVINEAIELAKTFAAEESHKFINGVLDRYAQAQLKS